MQVRRETLKPAHRFRITIRPHGDVVSAIAHINPRRMRMDHFQPWALRLQPPCPFLPLFPVLPPLIVCHHPGSSMKERDPVRPGDDRLRNLSNGFEGPSASTALATMPAIASTGAMLLSGHEAPLGSPP